MVSDGDAFLFLQFDKSIQRLLATRIAVYLMTFLIVTVAWAAHTRYRVRLGAFSGLRSTCLWLTQCVCPEGAGPNLSGVSMAAGVCSGHR